jgi:hypothetical protein
VHVSQVTSVASPRPDPLPPGGKIVKELLELDETTVRIPGEEVVYVIALISAWWFKCHSTQGLVHLVNTALLRIEERQQPRDVRCAVLLETNQQVLMPENSDLRLLEPHMHADPTCVESAYPFEVLGLQEDYPGHVVYTLAASPRPILQRHSVMTAGLGFPTAGSFEMVASSLALAYPPGGILMPGSSAGLTSSPITPSSPSAARHWSISRRNAS